MFDPVLLLHPGTPVFQILVLDLNDIDRLTLV